MALVTPLLMLILLGAGDYCRMLYFGITLSNAARAGAQFGAQDIASTGNNTGIINAAQAEAGDIGTVTVTPTRVCTCPNNTAATCGSSCSGYGNAQAAVRVQVEATFSTFARFPGIPHSISMVRVVQMRVK